MLQQDLVNEKLFRLKMTLSQLAGISGVGDNKLSPWLRGTKPLSNDAYLVVDETLRDIQALVELFQPAPVDLRNAVVIKDLLRKMKNGELDYLRRAKELADDPRNAEAFEQFRVLKAL